MTLEQIKVAVRMGLEVCWKNRVYRVCKDSACASGMAIVYDEGGAKENRIGLTWQDGQTLNGTPEQFYVHSSSINYGVDNALSEIHPLDTEKLQDLRYVGFIGGFELVWVAVWNYLGGPLDAEEACELAIDLLLEKKWFADESQIAPRIII